MGATRRVRRLFAGEVPLEFLGSTVDEHAELIRFILIPLRSTTAASNSLCNVLRDKASLLRCNHLIIILKDRRITSSSLCSPGCKTKTRFGTDR